jgi:3-phosphoshikimate 1-carboxyvinyltransferase
MSRVTIRPGRPLRGACTVPGDKSITQRAILIGALAHGETRIRGANLGEDAAAAFGIAKALGVPVRRVGTGGLVIQGGAMRETDQILDARNSGTSLRLSMGILAAKPFFSVLTGDESLRRRPVGRVIEPLRELGAEISARDRDRVPPVAIRGRALHGATVRLAVASAQVKSAVLLAAVQAEGATVVEEPAATRDHTERMLPAFGASVARTGNNRIGVAGPSRLEGAEIQVPGDASAAAFLLTAAALVPGSDVTVRALGVNPTRRSFLDLLRRSGADVEVGTERALGAEPVADVRVRAGAIRPVRLGKDEAAGLIDELPLVGVLAAFAEGVSEVRGAGELRLKESDRIAAVAAGLRSIGARVEEHDDGWTIDGKGAVRGGRVDAHGDHRIAMAFLVAGLRAAKGVAVDGAEWAAVSDPGFVARLRKLAR